MKQKVAIIGGGVGAITTAYAITCQPDWQDRFELTIYQMGWRLGGKGASGRNLSQSGRIEEHGLHIWAGFYDNSFRLMRQAYEELVSEGLRASDAPLARLEDAFVGLSHFFIADEARDESGNPVLRPWRFDFEPNDLVPGSGGALPTPFGFLRLALAQVSQLLERSGMPAAPMRAQRYLPDLSAFGLTAEAASPLHLLRNLVDRLPGDLRFLDAGEMALFSALVGEAQDWQTSLRQSAALDDDQRRTGYIISLTLAFCRGMIAEGGFKAGFDAIDDWEISDWLLHHGASREAVYSALFRGCYDYVFGFAGGNTAQRSMGAGTAIRGLLRLAFTYKGHLFYRMQAGMGDTIFAPYYQLLQKRGVRFCFFNAARRLIPDATAYDIAAIEMVEQARPKGDTYDPLIDVAKLPCWPSAPLWDRLEDGEALANAAPDFECEKTPPEGRAWRLEKGRDFDLVVLGASLGSLSYLASDLIAVSPRWRTMTEKVRTVATHAAQFWLDRSAQDLGWNALAGGSAPGAPEDLRTVITSFSEPLDTWADMSDLLPREGWAAPGPVSIAYFCSPCTDDADRATIAADTRAWADRDLIRMWPGAARDGRFDASILHAPGAVDDDARWAAQYYRRNLYGSERYVLSVPGSVEYRLAPDDCGFSNLFLAGDWTRCGINAGCVEAATISGLMAARGLTGRPIEIVGETDLGPDFIPGASQSLTSPYAPTAPWPLTPFFATGSIDGWFSFHAVDAAALSQVLPPGMRLHAQGLTPPGTHPVALLANRQIGVRLSAQPAFTGYPDYLEAIIAINHVAIDGIPGLFSYLPNLYLNSRVPQLVGVGFYGYNKRMGRLSMTGSDYHVASPTGQAIWSGDYQQNGFERRLMNSPECGAVEALCQQIVVSQHPVMGWRFSSFDFNLTAARIAPVHARIRINDSNLAQLPAGEMPAQPLTMTGPGQAMRHVGLPGAFRIRTAWTLSNPFDSGRLRVLQANRTYVK